jgi:hypothetical protein
MTDIEHVARLLARGAGAAEDEWPRFETQAQEAIVNMRGATPEVLSSIMRSIRSPSQ